MPAGGGQERGGVRYARPTAGAAGARDRRRDRQRGRRLRDAEAAAAGGHQRSEELAREGEWMYWLPVILIISITGWYNTLY